MEVIRSEDSRNVLPGATYAVMVPLQQGKQLTPCHSSLTLGSFVCSKLSQLQLHLLSLLFRQPEDQS